MKYQFAILLNYSYENINAELKSMEHISDMYMLDSDSKYAYCVFTKTRKASEIFCEKYKDLLDESLVTPFSLMTRKISQDDVLRLSNDSKHDKVLHMQISAYPKNKKLVEGVLDCLKITRKELATLISCTVQDIHNWTSMNALPDKLKTKVLGYLLTINDTEKDSFFKYLKEKSNEIGYSVIVKSGPSKLEITEFKKSFTSKTDAKYYAHGLREKLNRLDCRVYLLDFQENIIEEYSTLNWD